MFRIATILALILVLSSASLADDLYKVVLHSENDARALRGLDADVLFWAAGGYLVLADQAAAKRMETLGLETELIASSIRRDQIWLDGRKDRKNAERFDVLFEDGNLRLLLLSADRLALEAEPAQVFPLHDGPVNVRYYHPQVQPKTALPLADLADEIDLLIANVSIDSAIAWVQHLESYGERVAGTANSYAARDWIADKFAEMGYDSIVVDEFHAPNDVEPYENDYYNVMAYKIGTVNPEQIIVVGGHYDAVGGCPGADDNASGTVLAMELARVLQNVETEKTFVFVAFDAEEVGLWGSWHHATELYDDGEDVVVMINADMIAHKTNTNMANAIHGPIDAYAATWAQLAQHYVGISAVLASSGASDHVPYLQLGYDVFAAHEYIFSTVYHTSQDVSANLNFDYMTRMIQATLALAYTVDGAPSPAGMATVLQPGDGQSLLPVWSPRYYADLDYFRLSYYPVDQPQLVEQIDVLSSDTCLLVEGLTEGQEYAFYVQAVMTDGAATIPNYGTVLGTPSSVPAAPSGLRAMPDYLAVRLDWQQENKELDFDHCAVIRDGELVGHVSDTFFIDDDPSLGTAEHSYRVIALDTDGISSDTAGNEATVARAATLQANRILAVNRTDVGIVDFADETRTGALMREALADYDLDYCSDSVATNFADDTIGITLYDMIDYEVLVVGAEAARHDDIGGDPRWGGILDTLAYYLSIGGKLVVFGRWGDIGIPDTIDYLTNGYTFDNAYHDYFHIDYRVTTATDWNYDASALYSDLIGAKSTVEEYPELPWDSVLTVEHSTTNVREVITDVSGIPCAGFCQLAPTGAEVIYTYDSRDDNPDNESRPVAWRHLGEDYRYVYFDIPLSFFEPEAAATALRRAVDEVIGLAPVPPPEPPPEVALPTAFVLSQNFPNPFNPSTEIDYSVPFAANVEISIYNILGQRICTVVDEYKPAGEYDVMWYGTDDNGRPVATGLYLYRMKAGEYTESKKMLLLK